MLIPSIVIFYFFIIQFFTNTAKSDSEKSYRYFIIPISFVILNILRIYCQSFFPDIPNYKIIFEKIQPISFVLNSGIGLEFDEADIEVGYRVFVSVFKFFSNSFSLFLFFISTFQLSVFYFFCKKFKLKLVNAFPIYIALSYLTFQIGMQRQALAFCFFLLALVYINKKIIYLLFIALGFTFHNSMLICILFIWSDKFFNRYFLNFIFLISLLLYLIKYDIFDYVISKLSIYYSIDGSRLSFYLEDERVNNYLGIGFWERVLFFVSLNLVYTKMLLKNKITEFNNTIYNLGVQLILLQMIFFSSPTITSRLRYFILLFPAIFISEYIYTECKSNIKWGYQFIFSIYLLMYLFFQASYLLL